MRQCGKVPSHLMRFFRHAEHALVLVGMSLIDGAERRDERWGEIILSSSEVAHWKPWMASRVIGSRLRYLRYDRLHRTFPRVVVTAFCITAVFSTANILGVRIYFIRKLCRKVLVAVAQSAEWTAADRPFGTDTAEVTQIHVLEAFRPATRPLLQTMA
jgi:hypothetical protein